MEGSGGAGARLGLRRTTLMAKMKKLGISRPVRKDDTSCATRQDIGPRADFNRYRCTWASIIIDDEHRGIMHERHPPPSGKWQGMLASLVARAVRWGPRVRKMVHLTCSAAASAC